jgi:hypothetical protein
VRPHHNWRKNMSEIIATVPTSTAISMAKRMSKFLT